MRCEGQTCAQLERPDIPEHSCSEEDHQQVSQVQREGEHQHAEEGQNVHDQRRHSVRAEGHYRFITADNIYLRSGKSAFTGVRVKLFNR